MYQINKYSLLALLTSLLPFSFILGILITEILVFVISIIFIFICIKEKNYTYFRSNFFKIFLLIYFFLIMNSIFSEDLFLSLKVSLPYIRYGILSLAICFLIERDKNFLKLFKYYIIPVFLLLIIDGFIQYFFGKNIIGYSTQSSRLSSFFFSEWILGSFIQKFFPILLFVLFFNSIIKKNFYPKLLFITLGYLIVYLSGERAAFFLLSFYIMLICIPLLIINKKINKSLYLIVPIISLFFILSPVKDRIFLLNTDLNFKNALVKIYKSNYISYFKTSVNIFSDHIFFGTGLKTYRVVCKDYYEIDPIKSCSTHPHNYYFQILAETGLIGITIILVFFLYLIINYIRLITRSKLYLRKNFHKVLISCGLLVFFWPIATTGSFFNNFVSIILFFNLGFFLGKINSKKLSNII